MFPPRPRQRPYQPNSDSKYTLQDMKKTAIACLLLACLSLAAGAQTRKDNLTKHVYTLAADDMNGRKAGSEDAARAAAYIAEQYREAGLKPFADTSFFLPFRGGEYTNVVGIIEGCDPQLKNEYIVLGAHYDHLGVRDGEVYNGADDNASGSAALIEVARHLVSRKQELRRSVIIAGFDAEEIGLYGSKALAEHLDTLVGISNVKLMMSLDMVGWLRAKNSLTLEGVATIRNGKALLEPEAAKLGLNLNEVKFEKSVFTATDTEFFAKKHVPTLAVTTGLKSPYHKPGDDPELIDFDGLDKVSEYIGRVAEKAAADPEFAASGKLAPKHSGNARPFEIGIGAGIGPAYINFPDAAFRGKEATAYEAAVMARLNIGKKGVIGIQSGCAFELVNVPYPDEADMFGSKSVRYKRQSIVVPVQLVLHTPATGLAGSYFGIGGFWSKALNQSLGSRPLADAHTGLAVSIGTEVGPIVLDVSIRRGLSSIFTSSEDPSARLVTSMISLRYNL